MATIQVLDATGATQTVNTLPATGGNVTANSLPVSIASDQTVAVSVATAALPTGAATAALQSNVQSAPGTPQTVALTVQGNASGVALPVSSTQTDGVVTGSVNALNGTVQISTAGYGSVGFQVTGTWAGTFTVQGTVDGTNWVNTNFVALASSGVGVTFSTNNVGQSNCSGLNAYRLIATAWSSGTAVVTLRANMSVSNVMLDSPLPAGASVIGKVGIDQTTPGTTNGVAVNAALPAGANIVGKVGIDQTTPGTTNGVVVTSALPAGANTIGTVNLDATDSGYLANTSAAASFVSSTNNSSTVQLAANATFTGTADNVLNVQSTQILITSDQPGTLTFNQYIDSGLTRLIAQDVYYVAANVPFSQNILLPGNYFNVVFKNTGTATTTTLNINTTYGPLPVQVRSVTNALPSGTGTDQYIPQRPLPPVRFHADFNAAIASGVNTAFWKLVATGSGQTVAQTGGNLSLAAGTTTNSETIIRSLGFYSNAMNFKWQTTLSQRIANNNFYVELVDVIGDGLAMTVNSATSVTITFPSTTLTDGSTLSSANVGQFMYIGNVSSVSGAIPGRYAIASVSGAAVTFTVAGWPASGTGTASVFGWNYYQTVYNGTTATNINFDTQRTGYNSGFTTATINTTASPGHYSIINTEDDAVTYLDQLTASSTTAESTVRASRVVNVPNYNVPLYIQIRSVNGSTAPASTTTWTLNVVNLDAYTPMTVGISNVKNQSYQSALPTVINGGTLPNVTTVGTVTNLTTCATVTSLSQIAASVPQMNIANGSTNKELGVSLGTAITQTDVSSGAFAGSGRVNGTVIASAAGSGAWVSAEINVSAITLGTATSVFMILQESRGGTNFTDIWVSDPITTTGIISMPAIPVNGRRRWSAFSVGGTSTTVTVTVTTLELPPMATPLIRQMRDAYAATNPFALLYNSTALTASNFVLATLGSATTPLYVEGTKVITAYMVLAGSPTVTTQPVVSIYASMDGTNFVLQSGSTMTAAGNGMYAVSLANTAYKFVKLQVTTAAVYSAGAYTISSIGVNAVS